MAAEFDSFDRRRVVAGDGHGREPGRRDVHRRRPAHGWRRRVAAGAGHRADHGHRRDACAPSLSAAPEQLRPSRVRRPRRRCRAATRAPRGCPC